MNPSKSKNKIILIILLLIIALGISYFLYFKKDSGVVVVPDDNRDPVTFTIGNRDVFPNQSGRASQQVEIIAGGERIIAGAGPLPRLRKITSNPVAGAISVEITKNQEEKTLIRYIERVTGHIFELETDSWIIERISNTTIPKIYEAMWNKDGGSLYIRHILDDSEEIQTYYAKLKPGTTTPAAQGIEEGEALGLTENFKLEGIYLPKNIEELLIGEDGKNILYTTKEDTGVRAVIAPLDGIKGTEVLNSPLREITLSWPNSSLITFTTKPSAGALGFLYSLNRNNGSSQKILGNVSGLTTLVNPKGDMVLYGESEVGGYVSRVYDIEEKSDLPVSLTTLPEKCVWSTLNTTLLYCAQPTGFGGRPYPDSWYQGLISFSDEIWKIDTETGEKNLLAKPKELSGEEIDVIKLFLDEKEDYLLFTNKKDSSLWSFRLSPEIATSTPSGE